ARIRSHEWLTSRLVSARLGSARLVSAWLGLGRVDPPRAKDEVHCLYRAPHRGVPEEIRHPDSASLSGELHVALPFFALVSPPAGKLFVAAVDFTRRWSP